jgi:hypothetical protein
MSARGRMTMRAVVKRATDEGDDAWGQEAKANQAWPEVDPAMPCFAWIARRENINDDGVKVYTAEFRAVFPPGADIQEGDQVQEIRNRRGDLVPYMEGIFIVDVIGPGFDKTDAALRRVDGGT